MVEFLLILSEEWLYVGLVNPSGTLGLREGEKEKEEGFDFPIKGEPANEPFADVLDADEDTDDAPVHGKILYCI